ncbi:hypothetical protein PSDVSF_01910 [Pseudodesulfovibrio sediminis]|uniref:Uncharacterized protein n=1 Tax=Pseudodesulfovibrio sediminis TaxID=2810563 RepID=A0ABM7P2E2_9BACT|nr:hypothetical protein PSDVSF_01910 [Pseudodesulfovibrio sediminis]
MVVNGTAKQNNPVFKQARVDVVGTFSATGGFDDHGDGDHVCLLHGNVSLLSDGRGKNITACINQKAAVFTLFQV